VLKPCAVDGCRTLTLAVVCAEHRGASREGRLPPPPARAVPPVTSLRDRDLPDGSPARLPAVAHGPSASAASFMATVTSDQ
jgi:hypothetical protein